MPATIKIGKYSVKTIKTISEGGYGFVYLVEDLKDSQKRYALKKMIAQNEERLKVIMKELNFLKDFCQSDEDSSFIRFYDSEIVKTGKNEQTVYILLEVAEKGTLFDMMAKHLENKKTLAEQQIISIAKSINRALVRLHSFKYVYCDLKIENCLFFDWNDVRICDFGSVNSFNLDFASISKEEYYKYEEVFEKETTLMYRPPEMCDPYLKYKVNQKADMWMFGCVLYTLMFFKHPFFSCSKLAITMASYNWPEEPAYSVNLENLVRNLLTPNPDVRPSSQDIDLILNNWGNRPVILNSISREIRNDKRKRLNTLKNIGDVKGAKRDSTEFGFDNFDFSGLNKLSNNRTTSYTKPAQKKRNMWDIAPQQQNKAPVNEFDVFNQANQQSQGQGNFNFFDFDNNTNKLQFEQNEEVFDFDMFTKKEQKKKPDNDLDLFLDLGSGSNTNQPKKHAPPNTDPDFLSF